MALLDAAGNPAPDKWTVLADDSEAPPAGAIIVGAGRLRRDRDVLAARGAPLGVLLGPAVAPDSIADLLGQVTLVAVEFPKYRDGRGFTIARALREHHGFTGEIRAVGHILPDQAIFMLRSGFTSFVPPDGQNLARWPEMIERAQGHQALAHGREHALPLFRRIGIPFGDDELAADRPDYQI